MRCSFVSCTIGNPILDHGSPSDLTLIARGGSSFGENLIEYAGRVCYGSTVRMGMAPGFIADRVREGHEDILEHMWISVLCQDIGSEFSAVYRNRYVEVSNVGLNARLVSANVRVWLALLRAGLLHEALPICLELAPGVFGGLAHATAVRWSLSLAGHLVQDISVPVYEHGRMRVALLGMNAPMIEHYGDVLITHGAATFLFEGISRACSHQLVRHRTGSFSQASQRYIDLNKGGWQAVIPPDIWANEEAHRVMLDFYANAEASYARLRKLGVRKEDARFLLPNATETRLVMTMNFAGWRHLFELRALDKAAQWEIRAIAQAALRMLYDVTPDEVFGALYRTYTGRFLNPDGLTQLGGVN